MAAHIERICDAIVGVFARRRPAEACVRSLHEAGFTSDEVGFAGLGMLAASPAPDRAENGAAWRAGPDLGTDGVVGGVLGAVVAGPLPELGSVVAGGVLAEVVAANPVDEAGGGIAAALKKVGLPPALAASSEHLVRAGQFLVTVHGRRLEEAAQIVAAQGGKVEGPISLGVSQATRTLPAIEGVFNTPAIAEAFAAQLRAAFPDHRVVVEEEHPPVTVVDRQAPLSPRARVIVSRPSG